METLELGRHLLLVGLVATLLALFLSSFGILLRSRRCIEAGRVGFYVVFLAVLGSSATLVIGFLTGQYSNEYVHNYSERLLPTGFKVACLWAGLNGSLLFWTLLLSGFSAAVAFQHRWSARHPTGRRLEPYVYIALGVVTLFFVVVTWVMNPFAVMPLEQRLHLAANQGIPIDSAGNLLDGAGLNQQLVNYWFVIHPPTLYLGLVAWSVPFAFAIASLMTGELGVYWIRIVRRWTMVAWLFLTSGIILGGLWAYRQLGWGGYWAWDPVENASFLPWCTGTAFLHSVMIQERRDMLKGWNMILILGTFFLTIVATWMTRSGVVESVHAFAGGEIGLWFQGFLFFLAAASIFAVAYRWRALRGSNDLESFFSREAAFFLNNLVLVIIALAVFFLSFFPKIAHDWFGTDASNKGIFNIVVVPMFAVLLFLTAAGPLLSWVKTSRTSLVRNFLWPLAWTAALTGGVYAFLSARGLLGSAEEVWGRPSELFGLLRSEGHHPSAIYPTGIFLALCFFIFATVGLELYRALRSRMRVRGDDLVSAFFQVVFRNNRRWGGYTVHIGLSVLAMGIVVSSMFKVEEHLTLRVGDTARVGPYNVEVLGLESTDRPQAGEPYIREDAHFRVTLADEGGGGGLPKAHGLSAGAPAETEQVAERSAEGGGDGSVLEMRCERRFYPKKGQWVSEVSLDRGLLQDIYIFFAARDASGSLAVTVFINPMMMLIYLGWMLMIAGGLFAALPMPGSRVGLSD